MKEPQLPTKARVILPAMQCEIKIQEGARKYEGTAGAILGFLQKAPHNFSLTFTLSQVNYGTLFIAVVHNADYSRMRIRCQLLLRTTFRTHVTKRI
jgi:hypothetical protein